MVSVMSGNDEEREARIAADIRARKDGRTTVQLSLDQRARYLMQQLNVPEGAELKYAWVLLLEKLTDRLEALERRYASDNKQQQ